MPPFTAWLVITITLLTGALMILAPYTLRNLPAFHPHSRLGRLEARWALLRNWLAIRLRYPELGGYVHDTAMSQFIPPGMCTYVTGTWSDAAGAVTGTIAKSKGAADETGVINIPICLPQNSVANKGSYLKSVDLWWETLTAALDAAGAVAAINKFTLPADTAAFGALSAQTFTYDAGNDTAAETDNLDQHKMTLTLTTPIWLDDDDLVLVKLTMDAATTSAITFFGARANYTLRL